MKLSRMPDGKPEIFHTIQGEGRNIGMPAVFIRSSLCNLHCHWCDTDYTWNWEDTPFSHQNDRKYRREDQIIDLGTDEIVEIVKAYDCPNYVFTGGEPLLQEKAWLELMKSLGNQSHFETETNGTLFPGEAFLERIDQLNVSPKLTNSRVAEDLRLKPEVLSKLAATGKADFKFVIDTEADFEEVRAIQTQAKIPGDRIFLMPKANTLAELEENQLRVAQLAREHGYWYSDRLHLRLFGAIRGV